MASTWVARRPRRRGGVGYRVFFRVGGRESVPRHGGSFSTMREAKIRRDWIAGELAALRVPDARLHGPEKVAQTLREASERWQASCVDVAENTRLQHRSAIRRALPVLAQSAVDGITPQDLTELVAHMQGFLSGVDP